MVKGVQRTQFRWLAVAAATLAALFGVLALQSATASAQQPGYCQQYPNAPGCNTTGPTGPTGNHGPTGTSGNNGPTNNNGTNPGASNGPSANAGNVGTGSLPFTGYPLTALILLLLILLLVGLTVRAYLAVRDRVTTRS